MQDVVDLLRRVDTYLDAAPDGSTLPVDVGPLRAFVSTAPWPYYVRPRPRVDLTAPDAIGPDDVRRAADVLEQAGQPVTFEWIEQLVPSMRPALVAAGFLLHSYPLLSLDLDTRPTTCSSRARILAGGSPDLRGAVAVADVGFDAVGTGRGPEGHEARDAASAGVEASLLDHLTTRVREGRAVVAVVDDDPDGIVSAGWHQPVGDATEIVGVATLPSHRRRGAAAEVVDRLLHDARVRGCRLALLSASDDDVARVYERVGFTRIGSCGAAEPLPS